MHRSYVEALIEEEATALQQVAGSGGILRVERRGTLLVAELKRLTYQLDRRSGAPILGRYETSSIIAALQCDNYDTDPPSFTFVTDWSSAQELPYASWPHGRGIVQQHYKTGKPFLCRPGVREFHSHIQHLDEPWDMFRGKLHLREFLITLSQDLQQKQVL